MTLKEFLKPTTKKILWFLIIFVLFVPFLELRTSLAKCNPEVSCYDSATLVSAILSLLSLLAGKVAFVQSINYLILILGIIASYIFSCFFSTLNKKPKLNKRK